MILVNFSKLIFSTSKFLKYVSIILDVSRNFTTLINSMADNIPPWLESLSDSFTPSIESRGRFEYLIIASNASFVIS